MQSEAFCAFFAQILSRTKFNGGLEEELKKSFSTATEIADYLAREGNAFREAHKIAGKIVRACLNRGVSLCALSFRVSKTLVCIPIGYVHTPRFLPQRSPKKILGQYITRGS
jgi:argininosuccinate lyase